MSLRTLAGVLYLSVCAFAQTDSPNLNPVAAPPAISACDTAWMPISAASLVIAAVQEGSGANNGAWIDYEAGLAGREPATESRRAQTWGCGHGGIDAASVKEAVKLTGSE